MSVGPRSIAPLHFEQLAVVPELYGLLRSLTPYHKPVEHQGLNWCNQALSFTCAFCSRFS